MSDLDAIGGVPVVMKELLANGLIHGHAMTVTGKTVAENLKDVPSLSDAAEGRATSTRCSSTRQRATACSTNVPRPSPSRDTTSPS